MPKGQLRNKLFFFANFEEEYIPQTATQSVTLLTTEAQQGIFRYQTRPGEVRTANLLQIAAGNGFSGTQDPTIAAMFTEEATARQYGTITENTSANALRLQGVSWLEPQKQINYYPTVRLDYHVKPTLALMTSYNRYSQDAQGVALADARLPGPGRHVRLGLVVIVRLQLDAQPNLRSEPARRSIAATPTTRPRRGHFFRNGVINGEPPDSRSVRPGGAPADQSPVIGELHHHDLGHLHAGPAPTPTPSAELSGTQWRDRSFDGSIGRHLGLPRCPSARPPVTRSRMFTATARGTTPTRRAPPLYALLTGRLTRVQTARSSIRLAKPTTPSSARTDVGAVRRALRPGRVADDGSDAQLRAAREPTSRRSITPPRRCSRTTRTSSGRPPTFQRVLNGVANP